MFGRSHRIFKIWRVKGKIQDKTFEYNEFDHENVTFFVMDELTKFFSSNPGFLFKSIRNSFYCIFSLLQTYHANQILMTTFSYHTNKLV